MNFKSNIFIIFQLDISNFVFVCVDTVKWPRDALYDGLCRVVKRTRN